MPAPPPNVLIAYDGSEIAGHAVDEAARLFPRARAIVLVVWPSVRNLAAAGRLALPDDVIAAGVADIDKAAAEQAVATAEEGAARARRAGMDATPVTARMDRNTWATIVDVADEHGAGAVVVGSRGRSGIRSAILGSVSNGVVHHCRRPVVVVHPAVGAGEAST